MAIIKHVLVILSAIIGFATSNLLCEVLGKVDKTSDNDFGCSITNEKINDDVKITLSNNALNLTPKDIRWLYLEAIEFDYTPHTIIRNFRNLDKVCIVESTFVNDYFKPRFHPKTISIEIRETNLESIEENTFEGLSNLTALTLAWNEIWKIDKNAFKDMIQLRELYLMHNIIESLDDETFAKNINLCEISLSNNRIKIVSALLFSRNIQLEMLDFNNNMIKQIEKGFAKDLFQLKSVSLRENNCVDEIVSLADDNDLILKECFSNYAILNQMNEAAKSLERSFDKLEEEVNVAVNEINNEASSMENRYRQVKSSEEIQKTILNYLMFHREMIREDFDDNLKNETFQFRLLLSNDIETMIENKLSDSVSLKQTKAFHESFNIFRKEFSIMFSIMFVAIVAIVLISISMIILAQRYLIRKSLNEDLLTAVQTIF